MATSTADAGDANRRTIAGYENCARDYAAAVERVPAGVGEAALRRLADGLSRGARALEIGSGPGWDADFLETLGVAVDRTDAAGAFRAFQAERGHAVAALDVVEDALPGPYDAVVALCVLQHVERARFDEVLRKIAGALHPGGLFLASLREGEGEDWEHGESGDYRLVLWPADALRERLSAAGFDVAWEARHRGNGDWIYLVARRA
ncbi:methyltransferase domain-containing protein [Dokdonella fugitiva]|uniref:methyltransferase domain-containing protein n=1 Tax=Dokdonella fugitiva TaxID=328517 RepID=UPI0015FD2F85|nr:methyltransferase domain-containing protein [Dokdonella fugitiva]MBA8885781.1 SAM-dependent methyltransferase [Dokdonella fugitiva]